MSYIIDKNEIRIGSAKISTRKYKESKVSIGYTRDDIVIRIDPTFHELKAGQVAGYVINKLLMGEKASVSFGMLQSDKENFMRAYPMGKIFTSADFSKVSIGIGREPYKSLIEEAVEVTIHPLNTRDNGKDDETFTDDDLILWLCANASAVDITTKNEEEKVYQVTFETFADTTKAAGLILGVFGDLANTTLDLTPPSVSTVSVKDHTSGIYGTISEGSAKTNVKIDTDIQIVVSEDLDEASAVNKANFRLFQDDTDLPVTDFALTYDSATDKITLNPTSNLTTGKTYHIIINGLIDLAGNQQTTPEARRFTIA